MRTYFIGVHCSGKSTLIRKLIALYPNYFFKTDKLELPKVNSPLERQLIRQCRMYIQELQYATHEKDNPEKALLCDRSWIDITAYARAFRHLNWVSSEDYQRINASQQALFCENLPQQIVFINPPLAYLQSRLAERWETEGKKWNEENLSYLEAVHQAYQGIICVLIKNPHIQILDLTSSILEERVKETLYFIEHQNPILNNQFNPVPSHAKIGKTIQTTVFLAKEPNPYNTLTCIPEA